MKVVPGEGEGEAGWAGAPVAWAWSQGRRAASVLPRPVGTLRRVGVNGSAPYCSW